LPISPAQSFQDRSDLGNPCFDFIHFGKGKIMWGILLLAAVGVGVYFIWQNPKLRNNIKTSISGQSDESAMDILKKRYAQGEITKEKFEEMRKELEK
jgi:putative membrane protein